MKCCRTLRTSMLSGVTLGATIALGQGPPAIRTPASAPATGPAARVAATAPTTMAESQPAPGMRKPITPEMVAMFGGPSVEEQAFNALRTTLGSTAEEWKVIGPALAQLTAASRALAEARADDAAAPGQGPRGGDWANGGFAGPGQTAGGARPTFFGGTPPPVADTAPAGELVSNTPEVTPKKEESLHGATLSQALTDLKTALDTPDTTEKELQRRVALVREARGRARETLAAAQAELLPLLTQQQEAILTALGYLEE